MRLRNMVESRLTEVAGVRSAKESGKVPTGVRCAVCGVTGLPCAIDSDPE